MTQVGLEFIARNKANRQISSFNRNIQRMGRQMLAIAGVGGGLFAIQRGFRSMIKAASDAEETQAKFNTVFKSLKSEANKWAESFGESVGRSEQSVKSWMARLQDTFVPLGIARDRAMELSKSLVSLAVDVASFNNAADADVIRDFTSALVGNHETVRKYGIIIGEAAIKQEAMRKGLNKSYKELTDLEKVQLRYSLIQRGSTDAQGDALRTASSYANQVKRLKANIADLSKEIGGPFMQSLNKMIISINENKSAWQDFFRVQTEGWTEILSGFESFQIIADIIAQKIRDVAKITAQERQAFINQGDAMMGVRGRPGFGDKSTTLPPAGPVITAPKEDPWEALSKRLDTINMASVAKFSAAQKIQTDMMQEHYDKRIAMGGNYQEMQERMARQAIETDIAVYTKRSEAVESIKNRYIPAIQREIDITGRIGEAHYHAAKMVDFENAIRKEGLEGTREGISLMEQMKGKLKELEKAQRLARIADDIGASFATAFEDMAINAKKFEEVMWSVMRSVARSVMQNLVFQPMGLAITGAIRGGLGAMFGAGAAAADTSSAFTSPHGGPAVGSFQHGGWAMEPQVARLAEREPELVTPLSELRKGGGGGGGVTINLFYRGMPMGIDRVEQRYQEDQRIIDVWTNNVAQGGEARRVIEEIANVE